MNNSNFGNISMINLNLKNNNYSKKEVITNEEIEKGIEDSIKNLNIKDDNQKNILKLKLKSEIDKLKEIEIKIDIIDGLLEFLMKKSNGCNFYKEKIEKYETMKVKFFNLKEDILLEIEIIKCQLPPSNYF
jgi:hypothetical protein